MYQEALSTKQNSEVKGREAGQCTRKCSYQSNTCEGTGKGVVVHPDGEWSKFPALCTCTLLGKRLSTTSS